MASHRSKAVSLGVVPLLAVAFTGCEDDEETAYCVDSQDQVVQNEYCGDDVDGGGGGYFFFFTGVGNSYKLGSKIDRTKGSRISSLDKSAVRSRSGGFGSSAKGGVGRTTAGTGGGGSGGS